MKSHLKMLNHTEMTKEWDNLHFAVLKKTRPLQPKNSILKPLHYAFMCGALPSPSLCLTCQTFHHNSHLTFITPSTMVLLGCSNHIWAELIRITSSPFWLLLPLPVSFLEPLPFTIIIPTYTISTNHIFAMPSDNSVSGMKKSTQYTL